jgi:hypothetical protein
MPTVLLTIFPVRPPPQRRKYAPFSGTLVTPDLAQLLWTSYVGHVTKVALLVEEGIVSNHKWLCVCVPYSSSLFCPHPSPTNLSGPFISASSFRPLFALLNVTVAGPTPALLSFAFPGPLFSPVFPPRMTPLSLVADLSYTMCSCVGIR